MFALREAEAGGDDAPVISIPYWSDFNIYPLSLGSADMPAISIPYWSDFNCPAFNASISFSETFQSHIGPIST